MATELIINASLPETRIALLENQEIQELHTERDSERGIVGNIYKGKVIRVLPGMQAAFVDIGLEKAAFLYVDDIIFPDLKTPLATRPLPESEEYKKPIAAPVVLDAIEKKESRKFPRLPQGHSKQRGPQQKSQKALLNRDPSSPEDHALLQREYGKLMLDIDEELESAQTQTVVPAPEVLPAVSETAESVAPVVESEGEPLNAEAVSPYASTAKKEESPEAEQPTARAPQVEDDLEDGETAETEAQDTPAVQRVEPLIDPSVWVEDISELALVQETEATGKTIVAGADPDLTSERHLIESAKVSQPPLPAEEPPLGETSDKEEDADSDVVFYQKKKRRASVNISDLVREGQEILVQVAKEPIGTKGARLTCNISLPGRYLVFMPTVDHVGVSRRIESDVERRRLKDTMARIKPESCGVIVRTASGKQTDQKLKADLDYLVATWNDIQRRFNKQKTPSLVYQDLTIVLRAIRDMCTEEVDRVIVDSKREYKAILKFISRFIPSMKSKISLYENTVPIFDMYGIEVEIAKALDRKVWLKSGGYIVIDQAEALIAIDVNTGRYVGKKDLEETILKTNMEAVREIAYQLRLRNCGGIIILDLIDMEKEANREKVYQALDEELKKDRARPTILKISELGLIEMTRKRTRDSMVRSLCESCSYCEGKGFVKSKITITYDILRDLEREGLVAENQALSIQCHPSVADVLLEDKRDVIENMERQFNKKITIRGNGAYHIEQYELVAQREGRNVVWTSNERKQILKNQVQAYLQKRVESKSDESKGEGKKEKKQKHGFERNHKKHRQQHSNHQKQRQSDAAAPVVEQKKQAEEAATVPASSVPQGPALPFPILKTNPPLPKPVETVVDQDIDDDDIQPQVNPDGTPIHGVPQNKRHAFQPRNNGRERSNFKHGKKKQNAHGGHSQGQQNQQGQGRFKKNGKNFKKNHFSNRNPKFQNFKHQRNPNAPVPPNISVGNEGGPTEEKKVLPAPIAVAEKNSSES